MHSSLAGRRLPFPNFTWLRRIHTFAPMVLVMLQLSRAERGRFPCAILSYMPSAPKKIFLVDAMAHIYRAFFAPMVRMNAPSGLPTKVPFLFNNILRRLLKDYQPDYVGVVFDTSKPTFRDKLFEKYKAH